MSRSVLVGSAYGRRREQIPVHPIPLSRAQRLAAGMIEAKRRIPQQRGELGAFALRADQMVDNAPVVSEVEETLTNHPDPNIVGPGEATPPAQPTTPEDTL